MKSWEFFDWLLENCGVVGTPGVGFGECGEGYFRLTAFGDAEKTKMAAERIKDCHQGTVKRKTPSVIAARCQLPLRGSLQVRPGKLPAAKKSLPL